MIKLKDIKWKDDCWSDLVKKGFIEGFQVALIEKSSYEPWTWSGYILEKGYHLNGNYGDNTDFSFYKCSSLKEAQDEVTEKLTKYLNKFIKEKETK